MNQLVQKTFLNIKSLKIQGATAVAQTIVRCLSQFGQEIEKSKVKEWEKELKKIADYLLSARPTEPMAQNGAKFIFSELKNAKLKNAKELKILLKKITLDFYSTVLESNKLIVFQGKNLIKKNDNVFTHCHSSLVEQIFIQAKKNINKFQVYQTETRPLFQGRITAKNLLKEKIDTTMVVDSSASFLISHNSGKDLMMNKIILGADAILPDGSVINKIGSFGIALTAYQEKIPLYVAASLLKYHSKSWIKIEKRSGKEIWQKAPQNLKIINFAFDQIPAEYITGIICESGIVKPKEIKNYLKKIYPFLS